MTRRKLLICTQVQMNLEYPDHDKSCDDRSSTTEQQCLSLRNPFRFDFNINGNRGVIVERHSLCAWDACSQSCYAAKPDEDAATQVSHFLLLLVVFWATIPYCRCVMWLVETYLLAPSPWAKEAEAEYDPEAASQEILARCDGPAPAWWPTAGNTGAPPAPELYLSDGTPRAENDELIWPDSDDEDQDWVDGIVQRLEANVKSVEIDESARTAALAVAFLPFVGQLGLAACASAQDSKASMLAAAATSVGLAILIGTVLLWEVSPAAIAATVVVAMLALLFAALVATLPSNPNPSPSPCP